ncbi:Cytochrome P450 78A5 [Camellia lanceoleosa]|uniref:Cytochrome P450 78A5 n=1 Tax=Camellia lanceoleosa TaxID=1840588 RepID=A0ACC0FWF3_9ERIC|nr:Cytochrome P450 78A5 [Camellia lanceoleosa]
MAFSIGLTRFIISSHPDTAKDILSSSAFADRLVKESAYELLFHRAMGFAPYGYNSSKEFDGGESANVDEDREVGGEDNSDGSDGFGGDSSDENNVSISDDGNKGVVGIGMAVKRNVRGNGGRS